MSAPLLSVEGLGISLPDEGRGSRPLFRDLCFSVARGEVLAIIGQSGSGKTTLARAIVRLLPPHVAEIRGRVQLNGRDVYALGPRELRAMRRREARLVFQDPAAALNPTMRIARQVAPGGDPALRKIRAERRSAVLDLLRQLQLADPARCLGAWPFELSGGMKQRILIASSLLASPSLIVADEPTSALDPVLRNRVLEMFLQLAKARGTGVVLITHDLPLVARYADRALLLEGGTIADSGRPLEILGRSAYRRAPYASEQPRATIGAPVLQLAGVTVDFAERRRWPWQPRRQKRILDGIGLEVRRGEIMGLLGASGAGKTTLARCILGMTEPSAGSVSINGAPRPPLRGGFRKADTSPPVQIIYQNPWSSLSPKLSVHSIVLEPLRSIAGFDRTARETRFRRIMQDVGLDPDEYGHRRPHALSGGQRQRVAIARCLIAGPDLVVADEPVSSLDTVACRQVLDLLARLRDSYRFACLFISHDLHVLRVIADRIAVMDRGRIVECDTTARIFESPKHPATASFVSAAL